MSELTKDEIKKIHFQNFKNQLDEDYLDLNKEKFEEMFIHFQEKSTDLPLNFKNKFKDFVDFIIKNSSDQSIFKEEQIKAYLDDVSSEEEDEDDEEDIYEEYYQRK